jgi:pyruvate formate lyase activating enzyme
MRIGGFQPSSLLDYPDYLSAIVWTTGCPFRCPYCYNREMVLGSGPLIPEDDVLGFLGRRRGQLEALVVSGGEPLMQDDLGLFLRRVKDLGFLVKVDTNGLFPERLGALLDAGLIDYVAMDVKAPLDKYAKVTGVEVPVHLIERSVEVIRDCAPAYEFRTTVVPGLVSLNDVAGIGRWLEGAACFYLQQFKPVHPLVDVSLETMVPYPKAVLDEMMMVVRPFVKRCGLRGV